MTTLRPELARERSPQSDRWWCAWLLPLAVVVGIWAQFVMKMSVDWSTNGQYEFGIFVPFLTAFLLYLRWDDRPVPESTALMTVVAVGSVGLLLLLPIRAIQEANPEWRPLNWVHAAVLVMCTLVPVYVAGGKAWVRHFSPPLVLLFLALPWTLWLEQSTIQFLARGVSAVTTELLNWTGIPALQMGNVIEVPTGPVGVQDACTGIRSLAGSLMSSVFFGEYYRLRVGRRIAMVAGGLVIALFLNLVRTYFLCWIAGRQGVAAVAGWHDHAGLLIFMASFAALWFFATVLHNNQEEDELEDATPRRRPAGARFPLRKFGAGVAAIALAGLVAVEGATRLWYWSHERGRSKAVSWEPVWPEQAKFIEVSDEARAVLRYTEGYSAYILSMEGEGWQVFFFRWGAGRSSSQLAVLHRPEICLPATGLRMIRGAEPLDVLVGGLVLPFQATVFEKDGRLTYVFRTLWEERPANDDVAGQGFDQSLRGRFLSVWQGRRNLGQQLLQIAISGAASEESARAELIRRLPRLIEVKQP